jgi:heat shock protein HslJ
MMNFCKGFVPMRQYVILMMVISSTVLAACAGSQSGGAGTKTGDMQITPGRMQDIAGIEWHLQSMKTNSQTVSLIKDTKNTFSCDENGKVAGKATINRYFGRFRFRKDGEIIWDKAFGMTRMAGPPELMEQEAEFMQALPLTSRIYMKKGKLVLISADQTTLLEFGKIN